MKSLKGNIDRGGESKSCGKIGIEMKQIFSKRFLRN